MHIGQAVAAMNDGHKVGRHGWNDPEKFAFLVGGSTFDVSRPPLLGIYPEGTTIKYKQHIDVRTAGNIVSVWQANQDDVLANDWYIVE